MKTPLLCGLSLATLLFALSNSALARSELPATDRCVSAAIEDTYKEFPLHRHVSGRFYEWGSSTSAGWQTFPDLENRGFTDARLAPASEIVDEINKDYAAVSEEATKSSLLRDIAGKKLLAVSFVFNEGDLLRYFVIEKEDETHCEVRHLDTKIDDFDNG